MVTKLKSIRKKAGLKLREVADRVGVKTAAVHEMEVHGILTPRAAQKYAAAFPGATWQDLLEPPRTCADEQ